MLEIIKIKIENLTSVENQTYYFRNELDTIVGINKDTSNINKEISDEELLKLPSINLKSNGSGKTSIVEALHICLLGSCIKEKINLRQLIREGKDKMRLELFCKNSQLGLSQIRIIREIYSNKNKISSIEIYETKEGESEVKIPKSTSENMDSYILNNYIGLSKEDIDNFFIIQRDRFKPFLLLSDQKKKEILSRFTGISNFGFIEETLNTEIENWRQEQINNDKNIAKEEGQKESYLSIIEDLPNKESFEKKKEQRINEVGANISKKEEGIKNKESLIKEFIKEKENIDIDFWEKRKEKYKWYLSSHSFSEELIVLNKEKEEVDSEIKEIKEAIEEATKLKNKNKKSSDEIEVIISKLNSLLKNLIECPHCKFKFNPKDNASEEDIQKEININKKKENSFNKKVKEIEIDIEELSLLLKEKEKELDNVGAKIENLKNRKKRINNIGDFIEEKIIELQRKEKILEQKIKNSEESISLELSSIKELKNKIEEIKNENFSSITKDSIKYKQKVKELNKKIEEINKNKEQIDSEIQLSKDSLLNYNLFKNYLFNKIILEIEYIVNNYLQDFSDLSVSIKGNKLLADGKSIREEINCLITRNGKEISYFLLSSGEKAFIDIAFILTFQKILNITSNNGLNFLILDEITGIVDCANQEELIQAINKLKKPILFITHIPIISDFKTTYIIKENNISRFIQ